MSDASIINEKEYRVIALQRSGHHAVINWLIRQSEGSGCFLNNCDPWLNPFGSCTEVSAGRFEIDLKAEASGQLTRKGFLIYNYEDRPLAEVSSQALDRKCRGWLGASKTQFRILVLRDAFNLVASKLRWAYGRVYPPSLKSLVDLPALWKQYAKEFLKVTEILGECQFVNFNQWVSNDDYRRQLAESLEIDFTDEGVDEVARFGPATWGDSFDNLSYDGRARQMNLFDRWKIYANDPFYCQLVSDPELHDLSNQVFGCISGTEQFRRSNR